MSQTEVAALFPNASEAFKARNPEHFGKSEKLAKPTVKPRKYRNVPTFYNGREYQSGKEARYAQGLDLRQKAGDIVAWFPQVRFALEGGIVYVADFVILTLDNWEVHDAKGYKTPEYKLKRKLFKARYGREIIEV